MQASRTPSASGASDNVGNESAWVESASTTIDAVTKYYHPGSSQDHGSSRVAMRQGGEVYYRLCKAEDTATISAAPP